MVDEIYYNKWFKYLSENEENEIEEEVDPESIDLSSFKVQTSLNPKVWDAQDQLRAEIKEKLVRIVHDFLEGLDVELKDVLDITITGSLANYNWSKFSDIDLHVIVDFSKINADEELIEAYLTAKRVNWNKTHDIKIYGHDVEIYLQDAREPHASTGVYSVMNDMWNTKPMQQDPSVDWANVKRKAAGLMDIIDDIGDVYHKYFYEEVIGLVDMMKTKISKLRSCGLETGGEYSVENLAFKVLRRNNYLGKLNNYKLLSYDKLMSLNGG